MQEKSIVGNRYKFGDKEIEVTFQDPTEVIYSMVLSDGTLGSKQRMAWPQFRSEVIKKNESKVMELLDILEELRSDWEWGFKHNGKEVLGHFHIHSKGKAASAHKPSFHSTDPYAGEGELPELELAGLYDMEGEPIHLSKEEKSKIEHDAAEHYHKEHNN